MIVFKSRQVYYKRNCMRRAKIKCPFGIAASRFRSGVPQNDAGLEYNKSIPWGFHLPPSNPVRPATPTLFL